MKTEEVITKKPKKNYIDNKRFSELIEDCRKTQIISEELGEMFYLIAKNLSYSRQFINYSETWKNEMISDALYNFCRYAKSYNPEKGSPFAYFTTVAINAFILRIRKEKDRHSNDCVAKERLYNEFLHEYKLNTGVDINYSDDAIFLNSEGDTE